MAINKDLKPTESELKILQVLWSDGPVSVRHVNEVLSEERDIGYTTTLKLMQIMDEKGLVSRDTSSRTHIYRAAVDKKSTQKSLLNSFLNQTFQGSAMNLVMQTLGSHKTSREELDEIKKLIEKLENE